MELVTPPAARYLNPACVLPYGLQTQHVLSAMTDFAAFLTTVNGSLLSKSLPTLEQICMPANFSSIVGEFVSTAIPKFSPGIVRNTYHNGHPDLIPAGKFPRNECQHGSDGIEVKASRYVKGWQGHNAEEVFLMVIVYASARPKDATFTPFRFLAIYGAQLLESDWAFAGRSETSRRTITASVKPSGYSKMTGNWIYRDTGAKA